MMNPLKHMTVELTHEQFKETMNDMVNVTKTAEAKVDIWPYVELLVKDDIVNKYVLDKELVEFVYRNATCTYEHVLLPTSDRDSFIVIVIDLVQEAIYGHFILDLKEKYGLT